MVPISQFVLKPIQSDPHSIEQRSLAFELVSSPFSNQVEKLIKRSTERQDLQNLRHD
jgi:hypothetical protein